MSSLRPLCIYNCILEAVKGCAQWELLFVKMSVNLLIPVKDLANVHSIFIFDLFSWEIDGRDYEGFKMYFNMKGSIEHQLLSQSYSAMK